LICGALQAHALDYPTRNITIISNYPPAGGVDIAGRMVAAELEKRLKQSVIVEDKPGATGTIGAAVVAHAAPDGYTVLVTANPAITLMPFATKVDYDPIKDLIPIAKVALAPTILVVAEDSPYKTLKEFTDASRNPDNKILVGVPGVGAAGQIEFALLDNMVKSQIGTVPYRGATFIINDVLGHSIAGGAAAVPAMAAQIWAGKLRALTVVSPRRSAIFPEVPTIQDVFGVRLDGFPTWYGFFVAAGTPPAIVSRLETEILAIMKDQAVIDKMKALGNEVIAVGSKRFASENLIEIEETKRALKETNVSISK
jgi:tripartite-type tricarboxylate transporter receptor subunit TctC